MNLEDLAELSPDAIVIVRERRVSGANTAARLLFAQCGRQAPLRGALLDELWEPNPFDGPNTRTVAGQNAARVSTIGTCRIDLDLRATPRESDDAEFAIQIRRLADASTATTLNQQAQEQLRVMSTTLEQLHAAVDASGDGLLLICPENGLTINVNDAASALAGRARAAMIGTAADALDPDGFAGQNARDVYQRVVTMYPQVEVGETRLRRADGRWIHIERRRRAFVAQGQWLVHECWRDISSRKASQARQEAFQAAIDAADAIQVIDPQTMAYEDVNEAAARLFGISREEMLRLGPERLDEATAMAPPGATRARCEEVIARHPDAMKGVQNFTPAGGAERILEFARRAVRVDGKWLVVSVSRDITERIAEQRRLERLQIAMDQAGDSIVIIDPDHVTYVEINAAAAPMYEQTRETLLSRPIYENPGSRPKAQLQAVFADVIARYPESVLATRAYPLPSGRTIMIQSTRRAMHVDGRWLIVSVGRDITDRVQAEAELRRRMDELARSNSDLERFAYVTSHDLSEPLRMIASYTQLLARRYGDQLDDDGREFMGYVVAGAQRMKQLIDDLLVYSRAGRTDVPLREISLDSMLDEALANLEHAIGEAQALIERPTVLPSLACDKTGMVQLFQNLVANAIKFRGVMRPHVRIEATQEDGNWVICVSDNGIGIESKYFDRIFVMFQRLHGRSAYEGTGIGLAICKKIVERHGGVIWVESAPGGGASFKFRLSAPNGEKEAKRH